MPGMPPHAEALAHAYAQWHETKGASAELFVDLMAEDVVLRTALAPDDLHPMAQDRVGREHARDYLNSLALNLEMIAFPTEELVVQGDTVVWIGSCHWRDRRTGREANTPKVDVWRFREGKAVEALEMFDTLGFARFMGLIREVESA
jgi:ketosteroid isomerase-like protein